MGLEGGVAGWKLVLEAGIGLRLRENGDCKSPIIVIKPSV